LKAQYHNGPAGLGGNDDCGQMSAWYIFSSLGFYPIAPASDQYWFGSPAVQSAVMQLPGGKTLTVTAKNQSDKNVYVKSVSLNGKPLTKRYITHAELLGGGTLTFEMSSKPKKG
ncbi:MAG: glycoside hydrolase family 92 protein, partial [Mucilaginibacter polytrichastri]|nr:glycoside hydrolase family 92 protein [Mucilaginibacter polytrichastri]